MTDAHPRSIQNPLPTPGVTGNDSARCGTPPGFANGRGIAPHHDRPEDLRGLPRAECSGYATIDGRSMLSVCGGIAPMMRHMAHGRERLSGVRTGTTRRDRNRPEHALAEDHGWTGDPLLLAATGRYVARYIGDKTA